MRKVIYIAHPFKGLKDNVEKAEKIIIELIKEYPDYTFYSPLHATGFYYFAKSYNEGMKDCFEMLRRSDELWLCKGWKDSRGCKLEHKFANMNGIPIKQLSV